MNDIARDRVLGRARAEPSGGQCEEERQKGERLAKGQVRVKSVAEIKAERRARARAWNNMSGQWRARHGLTRASGRLSAVQDRGSGRAAAGSGIAALAGQ